jgi:hypothetical protein
LQIKLHLATAGVLSNETAQDLIARAQARMPLDRLL